MFWKREERPKPRTTEVIIRGKNGDEVYHWPAPEGSCYIVRSLMEHEACLVQITMPGALEEYADIIKEGKGNSKRLTEAEEAITTKFRSMLLRKPKTLEITDNSIVLRVEEPRSMADFLNVHLDLLMDRWERCSNQEVPGISAAIINAYVAIEKAREGQKK